MFKKLLVLIFVVLMNPVWGQYCTPSVTNNGLYIGYIKFTYSGIVNGVDKTSGNNGYSQYTGYSSGEINQYKSYGLWITVYSSSSTSFDVKGFADWNNDGDFDDTYEQILEKTGTVNGNLGFNTFFQVPLRIVDGDRRIRFVVTPSNATACGSIAGEVEDYLLTVNPNIAPVLNNTATPDINMITSSQTDNDGFSIIEFVQSCYPAETLITDGNDLGATYSSQVPRGLAIYSVTAGNGTWQYKVGAGSWTDFGAVSISNALQLLGNASSSRYQSDSKIRFVPTGTGSASFSYYAWDGTTDESGTYGNISSTGGSTAFSTATHSASITVVAPDNYLDQNVFLAFEDSRISKALINKNDGTMVNPTTIQSGTDYASIDIDLDNTNGKIYWINSDYERIGYANLDGSGTTMFSPTNTGYWTTGVAVGGGYLFFLDGAAGIYRLNLDGSNETSLCGGAGQLAVSDLGDAYDIDYYGGKLYFIYYSNSGGEYRVAKVDADGNNLTTLYGTQNYPYYVSVDDSYVYFSEYGQSNDCYVKKVPVSGGSTTTVVSVNDRDLYDLCVDVSSSTIYYLEIDKNNSSGPTQIMKVSTTGGTPSVVLNMESKVPSMVFNQTSAPLPVELNSFSAAVIEGEVSLNWQTATEVNNYGFEILRTLSTNEGNKTQSNSWEKIGFVEGSGNSNSPKEYSFVDECNFSGSVQYRLKQIDVSGNFEYSNIIELIINSIPQEFSLLQNYPNPFNPSTTINYQLPVESKVDLRIFDVLGNEVAVLVNESQSAGKYEVEFNATKLASGIYFYRLQSGSFVNVKKMTVMK